MTAAGGCGPPGPAAGKARLCGYGTEDVPIGTERACLKFLLDGACSAVTFRSLNASFTSCAIFHAAFSYHTLN